MKPTHTTVARAETVNLAYQLSSSHAVTSWSGRNISANNPRIAHTFKINVRISMFFLTTKKRRWGGNPTPAGMNTNLGSGAY